MFKNIILSIAVLLLSGCATTYNDYTSHKDFIAGIEDVTTLTIITSECSNGVEFIGDYWHVCGNYWEFSQAFMGEESGSVYGEEIDADTIMIHWTNTPGYCADPEWVNQHNYRVGDIIGLYWKEFGLHHICAPKLNSKWAIDNLDHEMKHVVDGSFHGG